MSKSSLKSNMLANQVENAVSLEKSRWFNKPAVKKAIQEMVYVDTHPMIVTIKKVKLTSEEREEIKLAKHAHKNSLK